MKRRFLTCLMLLAACLMLSAPAAGAQQPLPSPPGANRLSLLPHLDCYIDTSGSMDVGEAAAKERAALYVPLRLFELPRVMGVTWLRFVIAPLPEGGRPEKLLLDLGEDIPGRPTLYVPVSNPLSNGVDWQEADRSRVHLLPEASPEAQTCYIRLDGLPGFWFAPMVRTPQDAGSGWGAMARFGATLALGVVMLLCVLRGFGEKGQWRIWTSLYVGMALAQSILGMPSLEGGRFDMVAAAAVLSPGVALMLLPHVGRHFMATHRTSRILDIQFLLLSLPGAALALAPLVPQLAWTTRLLPLWPAATLIFVPSALWACLAGLGGGGRFLIGCLLPPLAVGLAFAGLDFGHPAEILASLPQWGVVLSALLIAGTGTPRQHADAEDAPAVPAAPANIPTAPAAGGLTSLDINVGDGGFGAFAQDLRRQSFTQEVPAQAPQDGLALRIEEKAGTFNLHRILRDVRDSVAADAERRGIGFSWNTAPSLGQTYEGDGKALSVVLRNLLQSSIRATEKGDVQFSVRHARDGGRPGVTFNVRDTGSGMPPGGRSAAALARAGELAGAYGGVFEAAMGPQGASITFTLPMISLDAPAHEAAGGTTPGVIVIAPDESLRRTMADALRGVRCTLRQASSLEAARADHAQQPASVLVIGGPEAALSSRAEMTRMRALARELPFFGAVAVTTDDHEWDSLADAGFTHALLEPLDREDLRRSVEDILSGSFDGGDSVTELTDLTIHGPQVPEEAAQAVREEAARRPLPDLFGTPAQAPSPASPEPAAPAPSGGILPPHTRTLRIDAPARTEAPAPSAPAPAAPPATPPQPAPRSAPSTETVPPPAAAPAPRQAPVTPPTAPAAPARPAAPASPAAPKPVVEKPAPTPPAPPAEQPRSRLDPDMLADLPDFVRADTMDGADAASAAAGASGAWITADGDASPTLQDAWRKDAARAQAASHPAPAAPQPPSAPPQPAAAPAQEDAAPEQTRDPQYDDALENMMRRLDSHLQEAQTHLMERRPQQVGFAAGQIADAAKAFGFRVVERLARNVERAGSANDYEAISDILPELSNAIERTRIALKKER